MANNLMTYHSHLDYTLQTLPKRMDLDEDSKTYLREVAEDQKTRIEPLEKRALKIHDDPKLTLEGKQDQFIELEKSAQHVIKPLEEQQRRVAEAHQVLTNRTYPSPPMVSGVEAVLELMIFQEIRNVFRDKSQSERDSAFLRALQQNQPHIARALTTAPMGPMVSAEVVERGKVEHAKRHNAENYERLLMKRRVRDEVDSLLAHAQAAVENLKGYKNNL